MATQENRTLVSGTNGGMLTYHPDTGLFTRKGGTGPRGNGSAGYVDSNGYRTVSYEGKQYRAHRLAYYFIHGEWPAEGMECDHINGIKDDNRWENLRWVDCSTNQKNGPRRRSNTSGVTGVSWSASMGKWRARIMDNYKMIYLGVFDDFFEAVCARKSAEPKYGYHANHDRSAG